MSLLRSTYSNNIYTIYTAALLVAGAGLGTPALAQTITNPASENLRATINAALDHAPALAEARADESAARAKLAGAKAERNPKLAVDGYAGVGRIDNGGFFGFGSAHTTPYAINATGEMPLYTGGRTSAGIEQASGGVRLARLQSAQRRLTVVVEAVATYTEVLSARQLVAQYQKLTQELSEVERQSELRFKSGEIPNSDLATVHARKAEGDAGLADAEGRLTSAEAHYQQLTGTAAGNLGTVPAPPATPVSLGEALEAARRTNPILKQADVTVDVARSGVHAAKADRLPTVGAFAQAGRDYDEFFPGYHANTVMVGVRGHWALWSGGRVSSKEDAANAEVSAAQARADA
ncbi:MAG: TolC family protein, partial [Alphaproteobacteria bacterium]|nr:TolC family protein [Alphaproteobacteria bacterium]